MELLVQQTVSNLNDFAIQQLTFSLEQQEKYPLLQSELSSVNCSYTTALNFLSSFETEVKLETCDPKTLEDYLAGVVAAAYSISLKLGLFTEKVNGEEVSNVKL